MSEFFLKNVGLIVAVGFGFLLFAIGLIIIGTWSIGVFENFVSKVEYRGAQKFGQRMMSDSYWFSEDVPTQKLIRKIGEDATLGYGWSVDNIRKQWREDRAKEPNPQEQDK